MFYDTLYVTKTTEFSGIQLISTELHSILSPEAPRRQDGSTSLEYVSRSISGISHCLSKPRFRWLSQIRFDRRIIRPPADAHHCPDINLPFNQMVCRP